MLLRNWAVIALIGILMRVAVSFSGHNFDLESWLLTADAFLKGQSYWVATHRWQYGPVVPPFLGVARTVSIVTGSPVCFHLVIVLFLSLVDLAIALLLRRRFGEPSGKLFILNPAGILLTGYHSQIDNVAILFAFMSMLTLERAHQRGAQELVPSALLFSLSLLSKHILFALPVWILFVANGATWRQKFLWCATAGATTLTFFALCLPDAAAVNGFTKNVLQYNPTSMFPMHAPLTVLAHIATWILSGNINISLAVIQAVLVVFCLGLCAILFSRKTQPPSPSLLLGYFLLALTFVTPVLADQYMVMALFSCCALATAVTPWWMLALITVRLFCSPVNILADIELFGMDYLRSTWLLLGTLIQISSIIYLRVYFLKGVR